jgi:O-antigen/teichoic acid export membrane protein
MSEASHSNIKNIISRRVTNNTIILYFRMLVNMVIGFYSSRLLLQNLGIADYGLYNVVGGIVTLLTFINGSMAAGTQRFITFEIGTGNAEALKKVFSTSIVVHLILITVVIILAETLGLWFVTKKMVFSPGRETAAFWVYQFSVVTSAISLIQAPFMASLVAHEKINIYAYMSMYDVIVKLLIVSLIQYSSMDKLVYYAALMMFGSLSSSLLYNWYCQRHFEECRFSFFFDRITFKKMFSFSAWDTVGSLAHVGQAQGLNIVINIFFGTVVNAASGIALTVNSMVMQFVNNFLMAANPQLIKFYANKQIKEMENLAIYTAKFATFLLLFVGIPVFIEIDYLLQLWLGVYPRYTSSFIRILLLQSLIQAMGIPTMRALHAVGNIRMMNILVGLMLIMITPLSYFFFYLGYSPEFVMFCNIIPWLCAIPVRLFLLNKYVNFSIWNYTREVIVKGLIISLMTFVLPYFVHRVVLFDGLKSFLIVGMTSVISTTIIIYFVGLNKQLRQFLTLKAKSLIK